MLNRRQLLAGASGLTVGIAGCSSEEEPDTTIESEPDLGNEQSEDENEDDQISDEPFYGDDLSGQNIVSSHLEALKKELGGSYNLTRAYDEDPVKTQKIDVTDNIPSEEGNVHYIEGGPTLSDPVYEAYYDHPKSYQLQRDPDDGSVTYDNGPCGYSNARIPFALLSSEENAEDIFRNINYVYEGIEEKGGEQYQVYRSKGQQMVDYETKELMRKTAFADSYVSDLYGPDLDVWESEVWFDKNKIIQESMMRMEIRVSDDEENIAEFHSGIRPGGYVPEEPDWLKQAKATVEGEVCEF